jgi:cardiolipin synthase A/B
VRSFRINDESNVNVLDAAFAARMVADFERDKRQSRAMRLEDLKRTAWSKRAYESFTAWFRPQL